jgi:hypothetical protein
MSGPGPDKYTGFTFRGKEIVTTKTRGRPLTGIQKRPGFYPESKRIEAATLYAVTGNSTQVSNMIGVPYHTVNKWTKEEWFVKLLDEIRTENDQQIDSKQSEIIGLALDNLSDRLKNGDFHVLRDGTLIRKPIGAKDLSLTMAINLDKRQLLRGKPTSRTESVSIENRLEKLVDHFAKLAHRQDRPPAQIEDVAFEEVTSDENATGTA